MSQPNLIIGIGNPDRGDDAVGPLLAKTLAKNTSLKKLGVEVLTQSGEGAELMELWQGTEKTIIIDAMKSKAPVGAVRRIDAGKEKLSGGVFHYSTHVFSLAEAVEMARALGRLPKSLIVYGIEGKNFTFGAPLSKQVQTAMKKVEKDIISEFKT